MKYPRISWKIVGVRRERDVTPPYLHLATAGLLTDKKKTTSKVFLYLGYVLHGQ
jgi:hypothetical protein